MGSQTFVGDSLPQQETAICDRSAVQRGVHLAKDLRRSTPPTEAEHSILFNQSARS